MHKDILVAEVMFVNAHPVEVKEIRSHEHMPPGVDSSESLVVWLENRNMPYDRPFCAPILEAYGVKSGADFAGLSHNTSVTDCYWFADPDEITDGVKWKHINARVLEWSESGEAIFAGRPELLKDLESPDFATGGSLPKVWMREPDGIFLLKRDGNNGLNTFAEIAASEIASMLNVSHVPYFFSVTAGEVCTGCPCIIESDNEELVTGSSLIEELDGAENLEGYFASIGYSGEYGRMNVLDFITGNWDRSIDDIGIIRNPDDLSVLGFAPVYDNGNAFFHVKDENQMRHMMDIAKYHIKTMENAQLDVNDAITRMNRIALELEIGAEAIGEALENFENRAQIYNQLVKSF